MPAVLDRPGPGRLQVEDQFHQTAGSIYGINSDDKYGYSYSIQGGSDGPGSTTQPTPKAAPWRLSTRPIASPTSPQPSPDQRDPRYRHRHHHNYHNPQHHHSPDSEFNPARSIYPDSPSPEASETAAALASRHCVPPFGGALGAEDISPPSSPEPDFSERSSGWPEYGAADVSPIDEEDSFPSPSMSYPSAMSAPGAQFDPPPPYPTTMDIPTTTTTTTSPLPPRARASPSPSPSPNSSSIPQMRRARRQQSEAALHDAHTRDRSAAQQRESPDPPARDSNPPRWDPVTGEQTKSAIGRPSQVKPADYAQGLSSLASQASSSPLQQQQPQRGTAALFGDRVKRLAKKAAGTGSNKENESSATDPAAAIFAAAQRPSWKGGSGRTALVDPVRDTKNPPPPLPLKNPKNPGLLQKGGRRLFSSGSTAAASSSSVFSPNSPRGQAPPASPPIPETAGLRDAERQAMVPGAQPSPSFAAMQQPSAQRLHQELPSPPLPHDRMARSTSAWDSPPSPSTAVSALEDEPLSLGVSPMSQTYAAGTKTASKSTIRRKPPPAGAVLHRQASDSSLYSLSKLRASSFYSQPSPGRAPPTLPLKDAGSTGRAQPRSNDPWLQPPSRFSVTTYATSTATGSTPPRASLSLDPDRPPVPTRTPPAHLMPPEEQQQRSIMDRTRPKIDGRAASPSTPTGTNTPIIISLQDQFYSDLNSTRNPTGPSSSSSPSGGGGGVGSFLAGLLPGTSAALSWGGQPARAGAGLGAGMTLPDRRASSSAAESTNKTLPLAPPETTAGEARDRVGLLNAQLSSLGNRRINVLRSIKQMTELMPTDNLMDSAEVVRKREAERRKVGALRDELADVQREEYELALKLHRAYKRMDRDAHYEPTTLWVRRVTD